MATSEDPCPDCGGDLAVYVEMREESEGNPYSREPYRVESCGDCEYSERTRMNNEGK